MSRSKLESAFLKEPDLILLGCRPWESSPPEPCPVCKRGIRPGDDTYYCARCDSMSPRREAQLQEQQLIRNCQEAEADASRRARQSLEQIQRDTPILSESQRRRLWMGYSRNGIDSRNAEVANRAKAGRDWLIAIGQEPDWSIKLDEKGRPVPSSQFGGNAPDQDRARPCRCKRRTKHAS